MEDDFDNLLEKFKSPSKANREEVPHTKEKPIESTKPGESEGPDWPSQQISEDFARDLAEGMEALLAGMKDKDGGEFKKHLEALVSTNGGLKGASDLLDVLNQKESSSNQSSSSNPPNQPETETKNFQEAIQETMEKLKQSHDSAKVNSGPSGAGGEDENLSAH